MSVHAKLPQLGADFIYDVLIPFVMDSQVHRDHKPPHDHLVRYANNIQ